MRRSTYCNPLDLNCRYQHMNENGGRDRPLCPVGGSLSYGQALRVSGLRVFGNGDGEKPAQAQAAAQRVGPLDGMVRWEPISGTQQYYVRVDSFNENGITAGQVVLMTGEE